MKIIFTCTLFLLLAIGSNAQRDFDSASYYAKELSRIDTIKAYRTPKNVVRL